MSAPEELPTLDVAPAEPPLLRRLGIDGTQQARTADCRKVTIWAW